MTNIAELLQGMRLTDWLLLISVLMLFVIVILLMILLRRKGTEDLAKYLKFQRELLERGQARLEKTVREEIARNPGGIFN